MSLPLWRWLDLPGIPETSLWLTWFAALVLVPIGAGMFLGVATQKGWLRKWLATIGLNPLSPYRTGWEWAFSQTSEPTFLLVTLEDGSSVAALFDASSLAASDLANRDLFLETVYDVDQNGNWTERQPREAILISGKSIRFVEFFQGGA